jgi:CDP-6-deoxy-D-xylo-4-hexulose-3-dehydrase
MFVTNALGFCGNLVEIRKMCAENDIILIEDNCESIGTIAFGQKTGNFGIASTFSFYVAHQMSTIEGGMVCTDNDALADMLRIVRANGWDRDLSPSCKIMYRTRHGIKSEFDAKYTFYDLGYNLRPTEITGFLGSLQLTHLDGSNCYKTEKLRKTL